MATEVPRGIGDSASDSRVNWEYLRMGAKQTYPHPIHAVREFLHNARASRKRLNARQMWVDLKVHSGTLCTDHS